MFLRLRQVPVAALLAATVLTASSTLKFGAGSGVVEDQIRRVAENPPAAEVPEVVSLPPRAEDLSRRLAGWRSTTKNPLGNRFFISQTIGRSERDRSHRETSARFKSLWICSRKATSTARNALREK